jgi:hypothetical protein
MQKKGQEAPTLPLPPLWRLIVAAVVVGGFLYFLYQYQRAIDEREAASPPHSLRITQQPQSLAADLSLGWTTQRAGHRQTIGL